MKAAISRVTKNNSKSGKNSHETDKTKDLLLNSERRKPLILLVPGAGIEPAQPQGPRDFKSLASTSSATQAKI